MFDPGGGPTVRPGGSGGAAPPAALGGGSWIEPGVPCGIEAVRTGVGTSARVITAAALIMITVFASFILNGDPVIKEFGVGLSIAILLDATIVRMVIVPATMVLLGEWNWYLPRWLEWLPRMDLPEEDPAAPATAHVIAAASTTGD